MLQSAIDGIERVGLRYVNEIRTSGDIGFNWAQWVDSELVGPCRIGGKVGIAVDRWQGLVVFSPMERYNIVLRYGTGEGFAVDPGGDLKRPIAHAPGPFFLIDIDSFWMPSDEVPDIDSKALLSMTDDLHAPVDDLFETLIIDRLRKEVLRRWDSPKMTFSALSVGCSNPARLGRLTSR